MRVSRVEVQTLFWKEAEVLIRKNEREEYLTPLTIRVLAERDPDTQNLKVRTEGFVISRTCSNTILAYKCSFYSAVHSNINPYNEKENFSLNSHVQVFRIYISNEMDPSFLYSLEIAEENYRRLKETEKLLVDFNGFSEKLVCLLDQCCKDSIKTSYEETESNRIISCFNADIRSQKFRAILCIGPGPLCHTLRLVESNAFKELSHLSLQLKPGNDSSIKEFLVFRLHETRQELEKALEELQVVTTSRDSYVADLDTCRAAMASFQKNNQFEKDKYEGKINSLKNKLKAAKERIQELEKDHARMNLLLKQEGDSLREARRSSQQSQNEKAEMERHLSDSLHRMKVFEAKSKDAETKAEAIAERCQGFEAALQQAESRINEWKELSCQHEGRANAFANELRNLKERIDSSTKEETVLRDRLGQAEYTINMVTEEKKQLQQSIECCKQSEKRLEKQVQELEGERGKTSNHYGLIMIYHVINTFLGPK